MKNVIKALAMLMMTQSIYANSQLKSLCKSGDTDGLRQIHQAGQSLVLKNKLGLSCFHYAIKSDSVEALAFLLEETDLDAKILDNYGRTLCEYAVKFNATKSFNSLYSKKQCVTNSNLMLEASVRNNNTDILSKLLNEDTQSNVKDNLLLSAVRSESPKAFRFLLSKGASLHSLDEAGYTIKELIEINNLLEFNQIIADQADFNELSELEVANLLVSAAEIGDLKTVKSLLSKGANINALSSFETTALIESARNGHYELTKFLIQNDADQDLLDAFGESAYDVAKSELIKSMLKFYANRE